MTESQKCVIVGASLGGIRAAQALRAEGFEGSITLIGDEPHLPYDRPPLSKQFLSGESQRVDLELISQQEITELDLRFELGIKATALHLERRAVELADGREFPFDQLIISTGSRARLLPWCELPGVHVLRTLDDAEALRDAMTPGTRLAIVGAGFIGCEIAATARKRGVEVDLIDPMPAPMSRVLGMRLSARFIELHERHGVRTHFGRGTEDVRQLGEVIELTLSDGGTVTADIVIVGIGSIPNTEWLDGAGLAIKNGILCDEYGRALGADNVYAIGDVASWYNPQRDESHRMEHWSNAIAQGYTVAKTIMDPSTESAHAPDGFIWSDQYDWNIRIIGHPSAFNEVELIEKPDGEDAFSALFTDADDRLVGTVSVNWVRAAQHARGVISRGGPAAALREKLSAPATASARS